MDKALAQKITERYRGEYVTAALAQKKGLTGRFMRWIDKHQRKNAKEIGMNFSAASSLYAGFLGFTFATVAAGFAGIPALVVAAPGVVLGWGLYSAAIEIGARSVQKAADRAFNKDLVNGTLQKRYEADAAAEAAKPSKKAPYTKPLTEKQRFFANLALTPAFVRATRIFPAQKKAGRMRSFLLKNGMPF